MQRRRVVVGGIALLMGLTVVTGGPARAVGSRWVKVGEPPPMRELPRTRTATDSGQARTAAPSVQHSGVEHSLVLLIDYADFPGSTTPASWADTYFGATTSVASFWRDASYGQLRVEPATDSDGANDGVVGWIRLGQHNPNVGLADTNDERKTVHQMISDALTRADKAVDFASYDANHDGVLDTHELHINAILAGYEASYSGLEGDECDGPQIWAHEDVLVRVPQPVLDGVRVARWGYTLSGELHCAQWDLPGHHATHGVLAHEFGHDLYLPDVYDGDVSSAGVGDWSIMGYGPWRGYPLGSAPVNIGAFEKVYEGWVVPRVLHPGETATLRTAATTPDVVQIGENPNGVDWAFEDHSGTGDYFLVENRELVGNDRAQHGCGLLVWHVNDANPPFDETEQNDAKRFLDILEADGRGDLDRFASTGDSGDPYPGTARNHLLNPSSDPALVRYDGTIPNVSARVTSTTCAPAMTLAAAPAVDGAKFVVDDAQVNEGAENATLRTQVRLTQPLDHPAAVRVASASNTALAGADYDQSGSRLVRFEAGETTHTIGFGIRPDALNEGDENFFVNLADATGAQIGDAQAVATVVDDDNAPPPVVLSSGVPTDVELAATDQVRLFRIRVPEGAKKLRVKFVGPECAFACPFDADLAVRRGAAPEVGGPLACGSFTALSTEACTKSEPSPGWYYIAAIRYSGFGNIRLSATVDN
jgi:M6 family metalloprotease-like protein